MITENFKGIIEAQILELPLMQYEWIFPEELTFKEEVRQICKQECPMYGKSWSCPPAVGKVEECRERCLEFKRAFLFTTIAEVSDVANLEETLQTRFGHEEITRTLGKIFEAEGAEIMLLSPEHMIPCIESQGILVTALAEKYDIPFLDSFTTVQWFGLILFK